MGPRLHEADARRRARRFEAAVKGGAAPARRHARRAAARPARRGPPWPGPSRRGRASRRRNRASAGSAPRSRRRCRNRGRSAPAGRGAAPASRGSARDRRPAPPARSRPAAHRARRPGTPSWCATPSPRRPRCAMARRSVSIATAGSQQEFEVAVAAGDRRDGAMPRTVQPASATKAEMSRHTASWIAGSRTMPFFSAARPASNCGLISASSAARGAARAKAGGRTMRSEMKLASQTTRSTAPARSAGASARMSVASRETTRGSPRRLWCNWSAADIDRYHLGGAAAQQHVGEAARSRRRRRGSAGPSGSKPKRSSPAASFTPPRDT